MTGGGGRGGSTRLEKPGVGVAPGGTAESGATGVAPPPALAPSTNGREPGGSDDSPSLADLSPPEHCWMAAITPLSPASLGLTRFPVWEGSWPPAEGSVGSRIALVITSP